MFTSEFVVKNPTGLHARPASQLAKLCKDIDALLCYAYLGDVTASVTGDKKAQKFEDDYLDDVIACIKDCGIRAVTYMPTRNTPEQLARAEEVLRRYFRQTSPSVRRKRPVPGLRRGHQLPAPVVRHQGHGKPAVCQPDRRDVEADRA